MDGVPEISLLPLPMAASDSTDIENKENIYLENDRGAPGISKETPMQMKSSRTAKGNNLRKSLAWNKAFFTEEGVLDPMELSMLSASVTKDSGSFLSGVEEGKSPLTRFNFNSERSRPAFHDLGGNVCSKGSAKSLEKHRKGFRTVSKLEPSIQQERRVDAASGFVPSANGISSGVPQSPAVSSQKRIANTRKMNPISKIPKLMPMKAPFTSKTVMESTKSSKLNQNRATVNTPQNTVLKGLPSATKGYVGATSSSAKCPTGHAKKNVAENGSTNSKMNPDPSFGKKMHGLSTKNGSGRRASSLCKIDSHTCGDLPAAAPERPSALRMPSPTIGFFSQRKVPSSVCGQSQKTFQTSMPAIPLPKQVADVKLCGESISATDTLKLTTHTPAIHTSCGGFRFASSQVNSAPKCLNLATATLDGDPIQKSNSEIEQQFETDGTCITNQEQLNLDCLTVPSKLNTQTLNLCCGSFNADHIDETPVQSVLPIGVEENRVTNPSMKMNTPGNAEDSSLLTENSDVSGFSCPNVSTQIGFPYKPQKCEVESSDLNTHQHNEKTQDGASAVMLEGMQAVGSSISELDSGFGDKNIVFCAPLEAESSTDLNNKQQKVGNDISSRSKLDCSFTQGYTMPVQAVVSETSSHACGFNNLSSKELETSGCYNSGLPDCEMQSMDGIELQKDEVTPELHDMKHLLGTVKSDAIPLKDHVQAIPFSDEWLAAVEAFGESILEMKTGAVQNSPPDKALPDPGPWSPVKKKTQDIGPFDCTKYSKNHPAPDV